MKLRVLIVGGGVIGSATAWFLARDSRHDVTVVERDPAYRQASSSLSASSIRQQFSQPVNIRLSQASLEFLREVGTALAAGGERPEIGLVERGYLYLATPGGMPTWIADLRTLRPRPEVELAWCKELAGTRTAVGVHGSHMLLPSALAGAVIDLLPSFKLPNVGQDLVIADDASREPKVCLFRYRMLPANLGLRPLSEVIVSTLRDADEQYRTTVGNRKAVGRRRWPRPPGRWRPLA